MIIQMVCRSLRVITDKELEKNNLSSNEVMAVADIGFSTDAIQSELQHKRMVVSLDGEEKFNETMSRKFSEQRRQQESLTLRGDDDCGRECSPSVEGNFLSSLGVNKTGEKSRAKAEKTITLSP